MSFYKVDLFTVLSIALFFISIYLGLFYNLLLQFVTPLSIILASLGMGLSLSKRASTIMQTQYKILSVLGIVIVAGVVALLMVYVWIGASYGAAMSG